MSMIHMCMYCRLRFNDHEETVELGGAYFHPECAEEVKETVDHILKEVVSEDSEG